MKTFQIKRSKWARGGQNGASALLNSRGAMCCLGFYCKKLGATDDEIRGILEPAQLAMLIGSWKEKLKGLVREGVLNENTDLGVKMMEDNDALTWGRATDEAHRESLIAKSFKKLGWNVKFVD